MEREDLRNIDLTLLHEGYETQWELMDDLCAWLDTLLFHYYRLHRWLGPDNDLKNMLGLVVSRDEFEHNLTRAARTGLYYQLEPEDREDLNLTLAAIELRMERTTADIPLLRLFQRCGLDRFQRSCVALAYAAVTDRKYEKLSGYLQDDVTRKAPGCALAAELFLLPEDGSGNGGNGGKRTSGSGAGGISGAGGASGNGGTAGESLWDRWDRLLAGDEDPPAKSAPEKSSLKSAEPSLKLAPEESADAESWEELTVEALEARFFRRDTFTALFSRDALLEGGLVLRDMVTVFLSTGSTPDQPERTLFDPRRNPPSRPLVIHGETARQLDRILDDPAESCVLLNGPAGAGKRFQIEHLCARRGERCVFADLAGDGWEACAEEAALCARLEDAWLCLYHLDRQDSAGDAVPPDDAMAAALERLETGKLKRFFLSRLPLRTRLRTLEIAVELSLPTERERVELFRACLDGQRLAADCTAEQLASTFRFSPRQIVLACEQAAGMARLQGVEELSAALLYRACYRQVVHRLGDLASPVPPAFIWDDVVMPESQKRLMQQACRHIQFQHRVYYQWGFEEKVRYGRGLSILFAGAPGTGKTMCAQVIANQLNMEMYKINLSQIVSKYIGETEKNLRAVFQEARNANCILFFDECDALFGKRSEVKDAHDRNANVEVAYLLQQIEEYDGVCILATNLIGNIDAAFMRRITYVVRFPFPDPPMREQIYRRTIPKAAPVAPDIDWQFLAEKFELSGGHIKNIVLAAAFMAAGEDSPISMGHLLRAAVNEMRKNDIVVVREALREYADLLDDE